MRATRPPRRTGGAVPAQSVAWLFDGLNQTMLTEIVVDWELLHSPACASELDTARGDVIRARQLDNLYRQALPLATQSYCQG